MTRNLDLPFAYWEWLSETSYPSHKRDHPRCPSAKHSSLVLSLASKPRTDRDSTTRWSDPGTISSSLSASHTCQGRYSYWRCRCTPSWASVCRLIRQIRSLPKTRWFWCKLLYGSPKDEHTRRMLPSQSWSSRERYRGLWWVLGARLAFKQPCFGGCPRCKDCCQCLSKRVNSHTCWSRTWSQSYCGLQWKSDKACLSLCQKDWRLYHLHMWQAMGSFG